MKKLFLILLVFFISFAVFNFISSLTLSQKIIFEQCQPEGITYGSFEPYCVYVRKSVGFLKEDGYVIVIGQQVTNGEYGHVVNYMDPFSDETDFKFMQVAWNNEGITLTGYLDHKLFIPKGAFIGGR